MPRLGPIKRNKLIYYLRMLGFEGPHGKGKHQYMVKGDASPRIPKSSSWRH
jgi:predicted RNA binding protein YcfA (HicA-like mRNA interferase family)